ncbi:MAG: hypothetical protein U0441_10615 [Polyangiaceae bacterium]
MLTSCHDPSATDGADTWIRPEGPISLAQVTFSVTPPAGHTGPIWLDDLGFSQVTEEYFTGERFEMEPRAGGTYEKTVAVPYPFLIRYRYAKSPTGARVDEARYDSGAPVVREAFVDEAAITLHDTIHGWLGADVAPPPLVEVPVRVVAQGRPVVDAVVTGPAGLSDEDAGYRAVALARTDVEGRVRLRLPEGSQRLVATEDGLRPAQILVNVTEGVGETTIDLPAAPTFHSVHVAVTASDIPAWSELRLVGGIPTLGFGYRDLFVHALRGARLTHRASGAWEGDVDLPEGVVELFVTLGDSTWGRERDAEGRAQSFAASIDAHTMSLSHRVDHFGGDGMEPVTFTVSVPKSTPPEDVVHLRPDTAGPSELPMVRTEDGRFRLALWMPQGERRYRYTRTPDAAYYGSDDAAGDRAITIRGARDQSDTIAAWTLMPHDLFEPTLDADPGHASFVRGNSLVDYWDPDFLVVGTATMRRLRGDGTEWVNLCPPRWADSADGGARMESPEYSRGELRRHIEQLHAAGFKVYLAPQGFGARPPEGAIGVDDPWWDAWFAKYRLWVLWFADLAEETHVEALSPWSLQHFPSAMIAANRSRWAAVTAEVRATYGGLLVGHATIGGSWTEHGDWSAAEDAGLVEDADALFIDTSLRWAATETEAPSVATLTERVETYLASFEPEEKPLWMRIPTASVAGVLWDPVIVDADRPDFPGPSFHVDEAVQARLFEAVFAARAKHPLLQGTFTWGYFYGAMIDNGSSIAGKAAEQVLRDAYMTEQ